jgi:hypothetical protein
MVVLGTDHGLQGAEKRKERNIDDPSYIVLTKRLVREFAIDYVFEEASEMGPTLAQRLADESKLRYMDVDPHESLRLRNGLPPFTGCDYPIYQPTDINAPTPLPCAVLEYFTAQAAREDFWVKKRIALQTFRHGLLICGFLHTLSIAQRLNDVGFEVTPFAYYPVALIAEGRKRMNLTSTKLGE